MVRILETLIAWRGLPTQIRMDNGPELTSHRLESWAQEHRIVMVHIQPGKPAHLCLRHWRRQNAHIERFPGLAARAGNRTFREDVLGTYLFSSPEEVRLIVEPWIEEYDTVRPHEAPQGLSPYQNAAQTAR